MSTEVIDDATEIEATRKSRREAVKRQLAEMSLRHERIVEFQRMLTALDGDDERLKADCEANVAKLDAELAALDKSHVDALLKGETPSTGEKRAELLQAIQAEERKRDDGIESNKKSRIRINRSLGPLFEANRERTVLENRLCGELADPVLHGKAFACRQKLMAIQNLREHAEGRVEREQGFIDSSPKRGESPAIYVKRRDEWQIVADDARAEAAKLQAQEAKLMQQMMDE